MTQVISRAWICPRSSSSTCWPALGVETGCGLVHQHDGGVVHERPGDGYPLALAAGEVRGLVRLPLGQIEFLEESLGPLTVLPPDTPGQVRHQQQVLQRGQIGDEVVVLEHQAHVIPAEGGRLRRSTQMDRLARK